MAVEEENVALLRGLLEDYGDSKGDPTAVIARLAEDVTWQSLSGGGPGMDFTRSCCGRDDVRGYFAMLARDWSMNYYRAEEFVAQGDRVVALCRASWTNRATGKVAETPLALVFRLKQGAITEYMEFYDTARAEAATL